MRILVVEDESQLAETIKRGLSENGYAVDIAEDGEMGQYMAETTPYEILILDIMLPRKDGITVCRELRVKKLTMPILILTARDSIEDRVKGLDSGADDYLVKPFAFSELLARVRALLRRQVITKTTRIQVGDLVMDEVTREVWKGQKKIELTAKEYSILAYFMHRPNAVISKLMIEQGAWDYSFDGVSNVIEVFIRRLRSKIDEEGSESLIQTVRGAGYRLKG